MIKILKYITVHSHCPILNQIVFDFDNSTVHSYGESEEE